ncbi:hypothetical protein GCM10027440_45070 [Nocardiopsis coralliicola]
MLMGPLDTTPRRPCGDGKQWLYSYASVMPNVRESCFWAVLPRSDRRRPSGRVHCAGQGRIPFLPVPPRHAAFLCAARP